MSIVLNAEQVIKLIPQKQPFVMVDQLVETNSVSSTSMFLIKEDNIFSIKGQFTEPGLLENIAQTAAVRGGYFFSKQKEKNELLESPVGFIGAVKNLMIKKLPKVGDVIRTTVTIENQVFDITMIKGEVVLNDEIIVSCQMKIFVKGSGAK